MYNFYSKIIKLFFFPDDIERTKYIRASSIARILLSLILIHRHIDLLLGSPTSFLDSDVAILGKLFIFGSILEPPHAGITTIFALITSFSVLIGFFSPISIITLSILDTLLLGNLNSSIVIISCLSLFLSNSWMFYSVDILLIKKISLYRKFIYFCNQITFNITTIRTISLFLIGGVYLRGVLNHFYYPAWINGTAVLTILRTGFFSDFSSFFENIKDSSILIFSKVSTYGMLIWESFILWCFPGIKLIRKIIFWWGLTFFISGIILLNIEYVAFTQIIIWILIFNPKFLLLKIENKKDNYNFIFKKDEIKNKFSKYLLRLIKSFLKWGFIWSFFFVNLIAISIKTLNDEYTNNILLSFSKNKNFLRLENYIAFQIFGQGPNNVFNENILQSKFHIVVCRVLKNGNKELVPFQDIKGGRLSYFSNDAFFNKMTNFQRSTKDLNWNLPNDKKSINKMFEVIGKDVSLFDYNLKKRENTINAYEVHLIENFPSFKDNYLNRWNFDKNLSLRNSILYKSEKLSQEKYKYRLNIPPGYLNHSSRVKNTLKYLCF